MATERPGAVASPVEQLAADFVWGVYDPHVLKAMAVHALARGQEGPALRELAQPQRESGVEIGVLFPLALKEMGQVLPTKEQAWTTRLHALAARIIAKQVPAGDGAYGLFALARDARANGIIDDDDFYRGFLDLLIWSLDLSQRYGERDQRRREETVARIVAKAHDVRRGIKKPWLP